MSHPATDSTYHCIDGADLAPPLAYRLLSGCVVPRPVAWVTTVGAQGLVNAAPFSAYTYVSVDPPMLAISIEKDAATGGLKDTARNLLATGDFVVNVADEATLEAMHLSASAYPPDVSEVAALGLPLAPSRHVAAPRIAATAVQMECRLAHTLALGRGRNTLYIGEVVAFHLAGHVSDGSSVDSQALRPVGRLGGPHYTTIGNILTRPVQPPRLDAAPISVLP